MSQYGPGDRPPTVKAPKAKPRSSPGGDVQSGGGYDLAKADRFKRTPAYRGAVRAAYTSLPGKVRHERIADAVAHAAKTHNLGPEMAAVLSEHMTRVARNEQLKQGRRVQDVTTGKELAKANKYLAAHPEILKHKQQASDIYLSDPAALKAAGFTPDHEGLITAPLRVPITLGRAAQLTAETAYQHPGQIPRLATDTARSIVSIPAGLVRTGLHPIEAAKAIGKDYSRRYGGLYTGQPGAEKQFKQRQQKEGIAPEVFDIAAAATAGGASAGRGLQTLAEAGRLGKAAERIATTRPALRVSGGMSKTQELSPNFIRNAVGAGRDVARKKVQVRRAAHEDSSALVREAQAHGEVTHVRARKTAKEQRTAVARDKSLAIQRMKQEQQRETHAAQKNIGSLSRPERRAFKYAMAHGITTPETAEKWLSAHRERVVANRVEHEARTGAPIPGRQNELPTIDYLLKNRHEAFTPKLAQVVREEGERAAKVARGDPGVAAEQAVARRYMPQAELLGVQRRANEDAATFITRVAAAAHKEGLATPGYFPSEKRPEGVFSAFAVGGSKAIAGPKAYTGALSRTGREAATPDTFVRGIAKNIKRKFNWNHVADTYDKHAFAWSKDMTPGQIKDELERRGIDPGSVALWNPGRYREAQRAHAGLEGPDVEHADITGEHAGVTEALKTAAPGTDIRQLASAPADFKTSKGWSVVPKAVHDEVMASTKPSGALARSWDIGKGKVSRILLASPAWESFQVGANTLQAGLAGAGPVDAVKAQAWWGKLSQAEKDAVAPDIGVHHWYDEQPKLGAATNNRFINAYRALKETPLYRAAHKANPFDAIFRFDNAQNNFFRRAVLYSRVKDEAYRRIGENGGQMMKLQKQLTGVLSLGPREQMQAILRDLPAFEKHAKHLNDFMGDYTTYTARERKILGRSVMFYGFLRYSLKFAFYTMPVDHPIMSSILIQMGRLEKDELKQIFGTDVPPWEIGNFYSKDGKTRIPLTRLSPFFNAMNWQGPGSIVGSVPPVAQVAINQIAGKNVAFDQVYTADGSTAYRVKGSDIGLANRVQIMLQDFASISPYYRTLEKTGVPGLIKPLRGKQSSDSSLFKPQPMLYKRAAAIERQRKLIEQQNKKGIGKTLQEQLFPAFGQGGPETIQKAKDYAAAQKGASSSQSAPPGGLDFSHLNQAGGLDFSFLR